ncbi:MAG TPA: hypothetical protein VD886_19035 [Herpetosiphonaceae bacterium]|nr:hypothetical protein [Herpetosiphonaceae bacterium]
MPRQQAQRREALESLEQAHRSLEQALSVGHPQGAGGLPIAAKMLDDSAAAFAQSNFSAAASLAQAVSQHLADLQSLAAAQRRRNCRLILDRLRRDVEPLAALPQLNQEVVDWIAAWQACSGRAETDLDHAWAGLRRLEERATRLHESALRALVSAGQTASLDQAGAVLQEMGFGQETSSETDDVRAITASRGTQRARVSCAPNGHATVEFTGFGDSSCAQAMQEFTRRMAARDVQGVWQARFSLTHATQQLVRLLTGAGLDVKVEPSDEGATIIAAGTARSSVTFDGQARLSPEMRQLYADQWERFVRAPEAAPATDQHALLDLELEDLRQKAFNDMQEQFLLKVRA